MRKITICLLTICLLSCFANSRRALATVIMDFETLGAMGAEGDEVREITVTDPDTGATVTVNFFIDKIFDDEQVYPKLVQEGIQGDGHYGFAPDDTPAGEVLGNGSDWMLGNGPGVASDFLITFTGATVENVCLDLIDFRADGPFSSGTPGSDYARLRTLDSMGVAHPIHADAIYTVPDPLPVDGNISTLVSTATDVTQVRLSFVPGGVDAGVVIDNLKFTVIPEPALGCTTIFALALFGLALRKR